MESMVTVAIISAVVLATTYAFWSLNRSDYGAGPGEHDAADPEDG